MFLAKVFSTGKEKAREKAARTPPRSPAAQPPKPALRSPSSRGSSSSPSTISSGSSRKVRAPGRQGASGARPRVFPLARQHRRSPINCRLPPSAAPQVRFSDDLEIQGEEASASRTPNGKSPGAHGRPPRSPQSPLHTIPSEGAMADAAAAAPAPAAVPRRHSAERQRHEHRGHHPANGGHGGHGRRHSSRHAAPDAPPPPEEVAAAVGAGGEAEGQPGSLAECARLFHKVRALCTQHAMSVAELRAVQHLSAACACRLLSA